MFNMKKINHFRALGILLILGISVACSRSQNGNQRGGGNQPQTYNVMELQPQSTTLYKDYPATLQGIQTVEIRPKIAGYIDEISVDEGAYVKKGDILFRLFANDIRASVRSAQAQVKVAQADVESAKINLEKTRPLVDKNIISKFELESVEAALQAKEAQLAQARANLANTQANLQYTEITSPTSGYIGNFPYRVGSLVSSTINPPLTTVSNTTSMYAYFAMNEKEFLSMVKFLDGESLHEKLEKLPDVLLVMADDSLYKLPGRVETASGLIDIQTGAVNMRATFSNPEGVLRSGGSGAVRIPQHINSAIIIPQKATYELQNKHFVYVVGTDDKVKNTEINVLVGNLKDSYVVTSGLKAGDKIVVEGIASLQNNMQIKPKVVATGDLSENMNTEKVMNN